MNDEKRFDLKVCRQTVDAAGKKDQIDLCCVYGATMDTVHEIQIAIAGGKKNARVDSFYYDKGNAHVIVIK